MTNQPVVTLHTELRDPSFYSVTKVEMIAAVNAILARFYGANHRVTAKAERMAKVKWAVVYEVAYLWRNDPIGEQVRYIEEHLAFQASF